MMSPHRDVIFQYVISTLYRILGQNLEERFAEIFVTGNAAEEREREKKRERRRRKSENINHSALNTLSSIRY